MGTPHAQRQPPLPRTLLGIVASSSPSAFQPFTSDGHKEAPDMNTTTLPEIATPAIILSPEQHADLRDLLEYLMDQQIVSKLPSECECGECPEGDIQCLVLAGQGLDILNDATKLDPSA
jgi:hypothetical protein